MVWRRLGQLIYRNMLHSDEHGQNMLLYLLYTTSLTLNCLKRKKVLYSIHSQVQTQTNLETVFEAVRRCFVAAISVLLPSFAEQQSSLVQEQVSLHWLEASQLLHACGTSLMADPHTEGALHQHTAQLANVTLRRMEGRVYVLANTVSSCRMYLRLIHV